MAASNNNTPITNCSSKQQIESAGGSIIENNDGSISVFISTAAGLQPLQLTKQCCQFLSTNYYFDIINQTCRWTTPVDCTKNNNINVVLNPKGNDGNIFELNEGDNCYLKIDFDYLMQFSCKNLATLIPVTTGITNNNNTSSSSSKISQSKSFEDNEQTSTDCDYLINQLTILQSNLENTPYSVEYNNIFYCLTENGLTNFATILTFENYTNFLDGDITSYTNDDLNTLFYNNGIIISNDNNTTNQLLYQCNVDPNSIYILKTQISELEDQITECQNNITNSNAKIITTTSSDLDSDNSDINPFFDCTNPISALESLNLSVTLDLYDDLTDKLTSIIEYGLINIGEGNLFTYLQNNINSGFLICGTSGCTDSFVLNDSSLTGYCQTLSYQLMNGLISEAANTIDSSLTYTSLLQYISASTFNSNWLHFTTTITNPIILNILANKKIKLSLKIKNICLDVCLLLDNIEINRICTTIDTNSLLISKNPSFELDKIIDNKKSWVSTENRHNREFDLTLRETNYNINDYRLAINTKEVELDISSASAIETDVWCYINDNPCILTGICETCLSCPDGFALGKDAGDNDICIDGLDPGNQIPPISSDCSATCGDGCIDLSNLITTPLTAITTIELFEQIITSELIDVKSRKTLSTYPTLRLLYDRYLNSSLYCDTNSSAFNYLTMDNFANLIGTYWTDLIEQVIPATTLWGSTYVYKNTIFDIQKFEYKTHNTFFCEQPTSFPFSGIGSATTVQVIQTTISNDDTGNVIISTPQVCNGTYIMKRDCGSEFIGKVTIISNLIAEEGGGLDLVIF